MLFLYPTNFWNKIKDFINSMILYGWKRNITHNAISMALIINKFINLWSMVLVDFLLRKENTFTHLTIRV